MIYLLLAILSMSAYMLTLKLFAVKNINVPQAITVNYALALLIGVFTYKGGPVTTSALFDNDWWYLALVGGVLFFFLMHLMAVSTRKAGVAVTTISSRTALVVPIIYSALILGEPVSTWGIVGVSLVIVALVIIFYERGGGKGTTKGGGAGKVLLPLSVFLIMGAITICMKSTQHIITLRGNFESDYPLYEVMNFFVSLLCALIYYAFTEGRKAFRFTWKSIVGGLCLGTFNYVATHSILMALKSLSTGVFYASYNICVVIITTIVGWLVFKENLSRRKAAGIILALVAIAILMLLG